MHILNILLSTAFAFGSKPPPQAVIGQPLPRSDLEAELKPLVEMQLEKYPLLMALDQKRLADFCPGHPVTDADFWIRFVQALCVPESGCKSTMIYREGTMDKDEITGVQVRSEGLFQLSYQDKNSYGDACEFDWSFDKVMALADYKSGVTYGNAARHIMDDKRQVSCVFKVFSDHLLKYAPSKSFGTALGAYFYTMNPNHSEDYNEIKSAMGDMCLKKK